MKRVDFGEVYLLGQQRQIRCPLVFRAPEAVLTSHWALRVDIASLGCTIFELIVGYPPFDNFMPNKDDFNDWRITRRAERISSSYGSHWTSSSSDSLYVTGCMKHILTTRRDNISPEQLSMFLVLFYKQ